MRSVAVILILGVLWASCSKNDYYVPEQQLVDLIVDLHLTEGIINIENKQFVGSGDRFLAINSILAQHNIERERFDSTMHYYALHIDKYDLLYDKVIDRLTLIETKIKAGEFDKRNLITAESIIQKSFPEDSLLIDSVLREFWWEKRAFNFPEVSTKGKGDFEMHFGDSVSSKAFLLRAEIKLYPDDCSEEPEMLFRIKYENDIESELSVPIVKDSLFRLYEIYMPLTDTIDIININGAIVNHYKCLDSKHAEVKNIRMYEIVDTGHPSLLPVKPLLKH